MHTCLLYNKNRVHASVITPAISFGVKASAVTVEDKSSFHFLCWYWVWKCSFLPNNLGFWVDWTELPDLLVLLWPWSQAHSYFSILITYVRLQALESRHFQLLDVYFGTWIESENQLSCDKMHNLFLLWNKEKERAKINKGLVISRIWVAVWFQWSLSQNLCHC